MFVGVAKELDTDADLDDLRRDEEEGMVGFELFGGSVWKKIEL